MKERRPTFSLVYATPLLQHQACFGLNPALLGTLQNVHLVVIIYAI